MECHATDSNSAHTRYNHFEKKVAIFSHLKICRPYAMYKSKYHSVYEKKLPAFVYTKLIPIQAY